MTFPCRARGMPADHKRVSPIIMAFRLTLCYSIYHGRRAPSSSLPSLSYSCCTTFADGTICHSTKRQTWRHTQMFLPGMSGSWCQVLLLRPLQHSRHKRCFRMRHHHSEDGAARAATITNLTHQSLESDTSSRTSILSCSPNPSQAFEVPSSSGERANISDRFTLTSNISALATPVSQRSKK